MVGAIERFDSDLAKQLRRAASSVTLNLAEGSGSQGRNRNARYFNALGSAREVRACVHVAIEWGYVENVDSASRLRTVGVTTRKLRAPNSPRARLGSHPVL